MTYALKKQVFETTYANTASNPGLVMPAPGLPGGEVYVSTDGLGDVVVHSGLDLAKLFSINPFTYNNGSAQSDYAAGILRSGTPQSQPVLYAIGMPFLYQVKPDGTGVRSVVATSGQAWESGPVVGSKLVYLLTNTGLIGVDPNTMNILFNLPFTSWNNAYSSTSNWSTMAVVRAPSGNADWIYFAAFVGAPNAPVFFAAQETDSDAVAGLAPTVPWAPAVLAGLGLHL